MTTWTNPSIVGNTTINNGRSSLNADLSLSNFASSMVAREASLPFTYDLAVSFFKYIYLIFTVFVFLNFNFFVFLSKDLYSGESYGVAGVAYLSSVCGTTLKYTLSEDFGGSATAFVS